MQELGGRLLPAACALALVFCFFFSLAGPQYKNRAILQRRLPAVHSWLPAVFLGLAVFLQHRTVWIVLAAGIASFVYTDKKLVRRVIPMVLIAAFIVFGYGLISGIAAKSVETQLSESATNKQTWLFRIGMWQALLSGEQTVADISLGKDLGGGYRVFNLDYGHYVNIPPHNEYVAQYLSFGLAGVALLLWFTFRPLKRFWKLSSTDMQGVEPSASAWVAVIVGIVVFSIPYQPMADAYALLGIANAMVFRLDNEAREEAAKNVSVSA
jgi:O-antigen ligase